MIYDSGGGGRGGELIDCMFAPFAHSPFIISTATKPFGKYLMYRAAITLSSYINLVRAFSNCIIGMYVYVHYHVTYIHGVPVLFVGFNRVFYIG